MSLDKEQIIENMEQLARTQALAKPWTTQRLDAATAVNDMNFVGGPERPNTITGNIAVRMVHRLHQMPVIDDYREDPKWASPAGVDLYEGLEK